jgi:nitrite reductase/ring-hydroxylating ferredoxin subunit
MTQLTSQPASGNQREFLMMSFFTTAVLLAITLLAALIWLLLPYQPLTTVGEVADFPPSDQPYQTYNVDTPIFIVNTGGEIFAFSKRTPRPEPWDCWYTWNSASSQFIDPCSGSKFALDGTLQEGPAERGLDRYEVRMRNGRLQINFNELILGQP